MRTIGAASYGDEDVAPMTRRREPFRIALGGTVNSVEKSGKPSAQYKRCTQFDTMKRKLKVIGALFPSNNIDECDRLLQVLDVLEDVDILRLAHTFNAMHGDLATIFGKILQRNPP